MYASGAQCAWPKLYDVRIRGCETFEVCGQTVSKPRIRVAMVGSIRSEFLGSKSTRVEMHCVCSA